MIEVFQDEAGEWRFRVKAKNGEIMATSEGYSTKSNAVRGLTALKDLILAWSDLQFNMDGEQKNG